MDINRKPAMQIFKEMGMFQLRDISPDNGGGPCITVQRVPGGHIYSVGGGAGRCNSVFVPEPMDEKIEVTANDPSEWCSICGMRKQHSETNCVRCDHPYSRPPAEILKEVEKFGLPVDSDKIKIQRAQARIEKTIRDWENNSELTEMSWVLHISYLKDLQSMLKD